MSVKHDLGLTVGKNEDFSEWYSQLVTKSGLADYAPVHGCIVFRELAYAIWEKVMSILDTEFKKIGVKNVYFPLLIPERLLKKEAEHFKGFTPEVAWVTHGGDEPLSERLAIRPTSETIMYEMYSKWIRSWRDLPLKLNQWCNIVRWEIKSTKPFLRNTEFLWQEGHTAHATREEALQQALEILKIYKRFVEEYLAIPVLDGFKTEWEKFAGAEVTFTIEALMPDGRALQAGTSHFLGQNFSKTFGIAFLDKDGSTNYVWQTSWGVSTRLIGAMVMVHGDDRGLVIPPKIAPLQAVIIPIFYSEEEKIQVFSKCKEVEDRLLNRGISAQADLREDYTPGWKYNDWELKGVPVRIEIGPRDVKDGMLTLFRRDRLERIRIRDSELEDTINSLLEKIQKSLFEKAKNMMSEKTGRARTIDELSKLISRGMMVEACWCGSKECDEMVKEETGASIRLIPFEEKPVFSNCVNCGKPASKVVYFARAY
ncbi:MAG: proline--tRNA ligase [Crenarchaeota archaeon]|nr:proline--tRNA ligase [Thermoproteota archaeon]MDW8033993.1 proline--tRNA ligase [Nitrososphaerota archaeon]